jgi:1,4-dihydroxy-6-naphthoate synthase
LRKYFVSGRSCAGNHHAGKGEQTSMCPCPEISIAYSADSYDAFLYWALVTGRLTSADFGLSFHTAPNWELDAAALERRYRITTISAAAYPHLADDYAILGVGACIERGEGPVLVSRNYHHPAQLQFRRIGVAGVAGMETLLARWACPDAQLVKLDSGHLAEVVAAGQIEAGVLPDQQLMGHAELHKLASLGSLWRGQTGLPLPARLVVVDRRLEGAEMAGALCDLLRDSLRLGLEHSAEALSFAAAFPGCQSDQQLLQSATRDGIAMCDEARVALGLLFALAKTNGLVEAVPEIEIIDGAAARSWVELPAAA